MVMALPRTVSARRIARELAVTLLPQLPRDRDRLGRVEVGQLVASSVGMLCEYARASLEELNALMVEAEQKLTEAEMEHPANEKNTETLEAVPLTTDQLRKQLDLIERAARLVVEALDVPETVTYGLPGAHTPGEAREFLFRLISTYQENKERVNEFIRQAKSKWKIDRMVSVDRDILRLACTEALFMPDIPINVAISEAVELSHRFADDRAAKYINGVLADLSALARRFRADVSAGAIPCISDLAPGTEA